MDLLFWAMLAPAIVLLIVEGAIFAPPRGFAPKGKTRPSKQREQPSTLPQIDPLSRRLLPPSAAVRASSTAAERFRAELRKAAAA